MTSIGAYLTDEHRACDAQLAALEEQVRAGDWVAARAAWTEFESATLRHFRREEDVLFPAFEAASGGPHGPTAVMRMEHEQIRAALAALAGAVQVRDARRVLGQSDTLMILIQQHNLKEEQILYPLSEQLVPDGPGVLAAMRRVEGGSA